MNFAKTPILVRRRPRAVSWALLPAACLVLPSASLAQSANDGEDDRVLDEIVVEGIAYGAARSLQKQRESSTLVTVVSEETLENIPEQGMAEALSRLPGIAILRDRGEAEGITIRGADSRLNAVSINGDRLLSPESTLDSANRGKRDAKLNSIPSTLVSEIQVYKAVPPNLDGDSIGGAVQIETKSATQLNESIMDVTGRYGYNELSDGDLVSGELTWGGRLNAAGTWGVIGTVSYESTERGISGLQAEWATIDEVLDLETGETVDLGGDFNVIETYDVIWRGFTRERTGANLTFDFKPSENSLFKFGGWFSEFQDDELRRRLQMRAGASADFTTDTTFDSMGRQVEGSTDGGRVRRRIREGTVDRSSYNYFLEGDHLFAGGDWSFDWRVSHTFADQVVNRTRARWEARGQDIGLRGDGVADWTFTNGNQDLVFYTQPAWSNDPDILQVGNRGDFQQWRNEVSEDEMDAVKLDFGRMLAVGDTDLLIQFGYKGQFRDRSLFPRLFVFEGVEDNPTFMREAIGPSPSTEWSPFGYDMGTWANAWLMDDIFFANPDRFEPDGDTTDEEYFVDETVHAAYLMGTFTSGRWTTIVGARFEDTESDITARDGIATNAYDNFLPAVITRFQVTENSIVRAAWTNGLGRPDFFDLRPFFDDEFEFEISDDTGLPEGTLRLDGGNPELQPFEAQSFDLSYEYYTESGGVFSAGVFYKEVENFEYTEELMETDVSISSLPPFLRQVAQEAVADAREDNPAIPADFDNLARFNYARPVNGDTAEITGFEFNFQQQFVNLPHPWDGFGVFANYTTIDGESDITQSISRDFVIGQFDYVANFQLFYEVEKFTARVAYNRNGVTYQNLGLGLDDGAVTDNPDNDQGVDVEYAWDFALQYRWETGDRGLFTLFFDVQNLTDEDSRNLFLGSQNLHRFIELENGGRSFNLGLRWSR